MSNASPKSLASESGQDECGLVDGLAIIPAQLLFLLSRPAAERLGQVAVGVLAADHETDLARGISGNRGVGIFDCGEDLLARLLEVGNEGQVKPLILGYKINKSARSTHLQFRCMCNAELQKRWVRRGLTTLRGNDTTFAKCAIEQLEVCLLE